MTVRHFNGEEGFAGFAEGSRFDRTFEHPPADLVQRAAALARERERAGRRISQLLVLPVEKRKAAVRQDRAYQSWSLCERLIDECHRLVYYDLAAAEEMAELALTSAGKLDSRYYGAGLVNDLTARAWAAAAEVLRVASDLRSAEDALAAAEERIGEGTGDALEEAQILEGKAALLRDQRRLPEAMRLLDEVVQVYRQYGDFHRVGRALVQKGQVYGALGDPDEAIHWLRKGVALVDPGRERSFELAARHGLMLQLYESGRRQEAWFLLKASRQDFLTHGGPLLTLRLRWLEGKIQHALGHLEGAETALLDARAGFVRQGIGFDAALVSLDLAGLYAEQRRAAEMRRLAEEMLPIFQSRDLHREAIAALIVFQQAVRIEAVSADLLQEIGAYLRQARCDHKLRFEPPPALRS